MGRFSEINVRDYGATGDGVTDDTAAIQAAMVVGLDVYFPSTGVGAKTEYIVSGSLVMLQGQRLYGHSPWSSTLKWVGQADGYALTTNDFTTIENLGFVGESTASKHGIRIYDSGRVLIKNVEVQLFDNNIVMNQAQLVHLDSVYNLAAESAGIYNDSWANAITISGGDIQSCTYGIHFADNASLWSIKGTAIQNCSTAGIYHSHGYVRGINIYCYFENNTVNHIKFDGDEPANSCVIGGGFYGTSSDADIRINRGVNDLVDDCYFMSATNTHVVWGTNATYSRIGRHCRSEASGGALIVTQGGGVMNNRQELWNSGVPSWGTWAVGDICWNNAPAGTEFVGWICVVAGTQGTWKGFGAIEA